MAYDLHKNFSYSLVAVAPVPAASGTTFNVTAGEGTLFPAAPFNAVVWPAGSNPLSGNAEIVRVTSKGTGDDWTVTRTTESSSARTIALGDQIALAITAKVITDIETAQAADAAAITALDTRVVFSATGRVPGGRLTLTTALPVTTADVTAATTLYYTPYLHNVLSLYSGTAWADFTFPELSIAVPATTATMYDVFVYDNAGTRTLELLAWTNDTTRATALVRQDGHWVKTGALTRLYVGSFRTTAVSGQTEDSMAKRHVWNAYNQEPRPLRVIDATATWSYASTLRQARATATNQVDVVVGLPGTPLSLRLVALSANNTPAVQVTNGIGEDSTSVVHTSCVGNFYNVAVAATIAANDSSLDHMPAIGRHYYAWLEAMSGGTGTWTGTSGGGVSGITGWVKG